MFKPTSGCLSVMLLDVSSLLSGNSIVLWIPLYLIATVGAQTLNPYFFASIERANANLNTQITYCTSQATNRSYSPIK